VGPVKKDRNQKTDTTDIERKAELTIGDQVLAISDHEDGAVIEKNSSSMFQAVANVDKILY